MNVILKKKRKEKEKKKGTRTEMNILLDVLRESVISSREKTLTTEMHAHLLHREPSSKH